MLVSCRDAAGPEGVLSGKWEYTLQNVTSSTDASVCSFTGIVMFLQHRGNTLTGSTSGGIGNCVNAQGEPREAVPLQAAAIHGTALERHVVFYIGEFLSNEGTFSGAEIAGAGRFRPDVAGEFIARRR